MRSRDLSADWRFCVSERRSGSEQLRAKWPNFWQRKQRIWPFGICVYVRRFAVSMSGAVINELMPARMANVAARCWLLYSRRISSATMGCTSVLSKPASRVLFSVCVWSVDETVPVSRYLG